MTKIISMLVAGVFVSTFTFAQDAPRNSRIASTEVNTDATESRFIEGISLSAPSVERTTTTPTTNKNTLAKRAKRNAIVAEEVELEPEPSFKDKKTAKEKLVSDAKKNPELFAFIEDWYGTPYRLGGTSRRAIDCSAFTRQLLNDVYGKKLERTAAMQYLTSKRVFNKEDLKEGDLVFFSIKTRRISHVGVYVGNGKFVHASSSRGVMISDLDQAYWQRYYAGAGRP